MADDKKVDLGLGGIFGGLGKLLELAQELQSQAKQNGGQTNSEQSFETPSGLQGVFGVNIRTINGESRVEPFGNVVKSDKGTSVEETTGYTVIVELPGVDANSILVHLDNQTLRVEAGTGTRKYLKVLELSKPVLADGMKRSYQNGILELILAFEN